MVRLSLSLLIGALFVWLAFRSTRWEEIQGAFGQVQVSAVVGYLALLSAIHLLRMVRWRVLLLPLAPVSLRDAFVVSNVGLLALMLLPLRLGEFVRPLLISERTKVKFSEALATIVIERIGDSLSMASLLAFMLLSLPSSGSHTARLHLCSWVLMGVLSAGLLFLWLVHRFQEPAIGWLRHALGFFPEVLRERLVEAVRSFIRGLQALPSIGALGLFALLTLAYWGLNGLGYFFLFRGFAGLAGLGVWEAYTVLAVVCVGLIIPGGPGMIGNFHYFVKLGLSFFIGGDLLGSSGMAFAILLHGLGLLVHLAFGVPCLLALPNSLSRMIGLGPKAVVHS